MNTKQERIYQQWLNSNNINLYDCYKKPSESKLDAVWRIFCACRHNDGKRFRILSYNSYSFTCAYCINKDNKTFLVWHSPYHCDAFEIPADRKEVI